MVDFLFVVPKCVLQAILSSWLTLDSVGRLDAALCVKGCRDVFEQLLQHSYFYCAQYIWCDTLEFLNWVERRTIHVRDITVGKCLFDNDKLFASLLKIIKHHLRKLIIARMTSRIDQSMVIDRVNHMLLAISMACLNLEELEVLTPNDSAIYVLVTRSRKLRRVVLEGNMTQLWSIQLLNTSIKDITILSKVTFETTAGMESLERLSLVGCDCFMTHAARAFRACHRLKELRIGCVTQRGLHALTVNMPNLLVFRCAISELSVATLASVGRNMPSLQTLILIAQPPHFDLRYFAFNEHMLRALVMHLPRLRQFVSEKALEGMLRPHPLPPPPVLPAFPPASPTSPVAVARIATRNTPSTPVIVLVAPTPPPPPAPARCSWKSCTYVRATCSIAHRTCFCTAHYCTTLGSCTFLECTATITLSCRCAYNHVSSD